jgi:parallel beta-helix repeat protein
MKRKWLAVGIILLFVGTCIIPAIAQDNEKPLPTSRGNWLYVGGSGPGNYTRIQDAIDNASDGDTVFVYDDSSPYFENLIITHSIALLGEHRESTIIYGGNITRAIIIDAENVTISGFSVFQDLKLDNSIEVKHNFFSISDCIINNPKEGAIDIDSKKSFGTISNNILLGPPGYWGMRFCGTNSNITVKNNFFNSSVDMLWGIDNTFENNTFQGSNVDIDGFRITLNKNYFNNCHSVELSRESLIINNNVLTHCGFSIQPKSIEICVNNTVNGKPFVFLQNGHGMIIDDAGQVYCEDSSEITIQNLTFEEVNNGIYLLNTENSVIQENLLLRSNIHIDMSKNIQVRNNTITAKGAALTILYDIGISIGSSENVMVTGNRLLNCSYSGISSGGSKITIRNNNFIGNYIGLEAGSGNNITENIFIGNDIGLEVYSGNTILGNHIEKSRIALILSDASNTKINQNNFINNTKDATFSELSRFHGNNWDNNYWDDAFFPFGYKFIFGTVQTRIPRIWQTFPGETLYYWIRWINLDRNPAQVPYDIPGMS